MITATCVMWSDCVVRESEGKPVEAEPLKSSVGVLLNG